MKPLFIFLCLVSLCIPAHSQIQPFGDYNVSIGANNYFENEGSGLHLGGSSHFMGGLRYGIFSIDAGVGVLILSDKAKYDFKEESILRYTILDFPLGANVTLPLNHMEICFGVDCSGWLAKDFTLISPHIDFLYNGKASDRGVFLKFYTDLDPHNRTAPQYFGIGYKAVFR